MTQVDQPVPGQPVPGTPAPDPSTPPRFGRIRVRRVVFIVLAAVLVLQVGYFGRIGLTWFMQYRRTTPAYDPPVLAGQVVSPGCSGGVYARTAEGVLVITTTGHCSNAGDPKSMPDGGRFVGHASAPSNWASCDRPGKNRCTASDMAYVLLVPEMIPWGHLNEIDLGAGGTRVIAAGTAALSCPDVKQGGRVEINGQGGFRQGGIIGQQANDFPEDGTYFPCITVTDVDVVSGDSGGVVLVEGIPAGVASRSYAGKLGFTPLAEGLEEMGLTMCDTADCGLERPAATAQP
ncbi:MAG TPA: hypothetical protein VES19_04195 [Candidatus Limnocylindrales bacterium]|nr:hypothetical protein [Candidatus Limnocylindrales bacterium]